MALQERYSELVLAKLRSVSVFADIVGRQFEGDPKAGAVEVPVRAEASVSAYDPAKGLDGTNTETTFTKILIDKDYAVNEIIDGYEAQALPDGKIAERLDSAGYALGKQVDDDIVSALVSNCTEASTTKTKIVGQILDTIAEAKALGVDADKLWVAVTPAVYAELINDTLFTLSTSVEDMENGKIGRIAGVPIYETNNANFTKKFIVANSDFTHCVADFKVEPTVRDGVGQYIGSSQVVARLVYGVAVTKAETILGK